MPIHTYLDLDVVNYNLNSSAAAPHLRFEETRNSPFLEGDTSEYFCSIVRFSIQTGNSLPIFIPRIETGQGDINKTVYKVTLYLEADKGTYYQCNTSLLFTATDSTAEVPQAPLIQQDMNGSYYYQYCIKDIVTMFNAGLQKAWEGLVNLIPIKTDQYDKMDLRNIFNAAYRPFFEYDYDKCRLVLNVDQTFPTGTHNNGVPTTTTFTTYTGSLYFNTRFYELLSGLSCIRKNREGDLNYLFNPDLSITRTVKDSNLVSHNMWQTVQEISSIAMWNPIASIAFCTGMLPIFPTNTSLPMTYGGTTDDNLSSNGNNSNLTNIISDFEIAVSDANQYRPIIVYNPSSEYRLIDMHTMQNLKQIDISVFWKTQFGDYIPLRLQPGCAAHIKLMFRHKTFYLGY